MKAIWVDFVVLGLYIAGLVGISWYTRKKAKSMNEFLMAGKGVGGVMSAFAYGVTYFSAVMFIGYAGKLGYQFGLASLWIGIGNAVIGCYLAWVVLAKRSRRATRFYGARTMPELFEKRFESKYIKLVCAVVIFVFLVPYAASVYQGLGYLFELIFGIPFWSVALIMAVLTAVYVFFGGYLATVLTDFFQGIIMLFGITVMVGFVMNYENVNNIVSSLGQRLGGAGVPGFFGSGMFTGAQVYSLVMLVLLTSVGVWGLPQMVKKFNTMKTEKGIRQATWVSTGFAVIIGVGAYFVGCFSRYVLGPETAAVMAADQIVPNILVQALPAGLLGLIIILIMSASMSTLAALALTSSSAVSMDIYKGYIKKDSPEKRINLLMRILCLFFILISVLIAVFQPAGIIELMSLSWGTIAGCFLAPYIAAVYDKKATKAGAYASIIVSLSLTLILYILFLTLPAPVKLYFEPPAIGVFAMALSLTVNPIVSRLTQKTAPDAQAVETLFKNLTSKEDPDQKTEEAEGIAKITKEA